MQHLEGLSRPEMRESRPAYEAERLPILALAGDDEILSTEALRSQLLTVHGGIPPIIARHWLREEMEEVLFAALLTPFSGASIQEGGAR